MSHSSHEPGDLARLDGLVTSLGAGQDRVDVLYDKAEITAGAQWRDVINAMLVECDAAVVLLTPDALRSPWVLKEATILRLRYDQDPGFPLLVWPGVDPAELRKNLLWDPVDLPAIQFLDGPDVAAMAASVKDKLTPLAAQFRPTPLDLFAAEIAQRLARVPAVHLQSALDTLSERIPFWIDGQPGHQRLGYAIARWVLRQPPPALLRIARVLALLGGTIPADDAREILEIVAPMWVELDAAYWFVRADWRHPAGLRDVAIACGRPTQTLRQYVDRAYRPSRPPRILLLNGVTGGEHTDDICRELRDVIRPQLEGQLRRKLDDPAVDEFLGRTTVRLYVALRLPDDPQVVTSLQARYPHVTFVFYVPPGISTLGEAACAAAGVGWVTPSLDPELEELVAADYDDALFTFLP